MADYRQLIVAFLATVVVIGGLAAFVSWKNGELERLTTADSFADVEIPANDENSAPVDDVKIPNAPTPVAPDNQTNPMQPNPVVVFDTNQGKIEIELFMDVAPITAGNFMKLAQEGYYNGTKFHRVIDGFMIQGGDPNSKGDDASMYGRGGPGYTIKDEFAPGLSNVRGTLSMANAGPNTGGSQFFINLVPNTFLDGKHAVFGRVVSGMEVADKISLVPRNDRDVPLEPVVVNSVSVK
jgi:cyclophilin family peptidyl-prolyl cis-trans isomerase